MKISKKVEEAINKQINAEIYSAYLYLGMSARFTELNLKGMANWLYVQAQEEMTHAMKFYRFNLERGGHAKLPRRLQGEYLFDETESVLGDRDTVPGGGAGTRTGRGREAGAREPG